jgi:hypothetical protein
MLAPAFKKVVKSHGKKRAAEEDIMNVLEKIADENDTTVEGGLGTRESKAEQISKEK